MPPRSQKTSRLSCQAPPAPSSAPLTADQTAALKKLHNAAVQLEGVFVGMLTQYTVKGVSKDNYFFGVQAVDRDGNASVAAYPAPLR